MSNERVALIGLDYYETLVRVSPAVRSAAFDQIGRDVGLVLPSGTLFRGWQELARESWPFSGPRPAFRTMRDTWAEVGEQLLGKFGVRGGGILVADRSCELHAAAKPTTEVVAHFSRLARRYPLALLSDADAEHLLPSLESSGLHRHLTQVLFSEKLRNYKPHIEMFLTLARYAGVQPQHVLYVGDNPRADILGASNAGMRTAWINRGTTAWPFSLSPPDLELHEITDLDIGRIPDAGL